jgi:hypothetical protein
LINPLIISGDIELRDLRGSFGAFIDVLDHGLATDRFQRLARKAGRIVAGWYKGEDLHSV